jgi:hypothetical protein
MHNTTLSDLERLTRFTFYNGNKIYQYRGVEDGMHVYFSIGKKKYPTVYKVAVKSKKAKAPVIIQP